MDGNGIHHHCLTVLLSKNLETHVPTGLAHPLHTHTHTHTHILMIARTPLVSILHGHNENSLMKIYIGEDGAQVIPPCLACPGTILTTIIFSGAHR